MLVQCPFNAGHRMPESSLEKHMAKCPDKPADSKNLGPQPPPTALAGMKRQASTSLMPAVKHARQGAGGKIVPLSAQPSQIRPPASRTTSTTLAHLSDRTFESLSVHPALHRSLTEVFQYSMMTKIQEAAIPACLLGGDVIAKAKTGTGKTLAFLIPALHRVLSSHVANTKATPIKILVLSPTRELAMQTADECKSLLNFEPSHHVMTVLGGTNMRTETSAFKAQPPLALVATPGRLDDHLQNSGLAPLLHGLAVLIFDEADQLLDMGFRPAIQKILAKLPPREKRQTLLFSATFPTQLQELTAWALRPSTEFIDCIGVEEEASNQQVEQASMICTWENLLPTAFAIIADLVQEPHKIIVFLPTAFEAAFFAGLARCIGIQTTVMEIHSRKSQNQRTKISEEFRNISAGILFSSDVSARGMDYPDVTFVLQVGAPPDRDQYLHRLGRTARAGKEGSGVLLLCDFERYFLDVLKDLPLTHRPLPSAVALRKTRTAVDSALTQLHREDSNIGAQAYRAWLGSRKSICGKLKWSTTKLVERANYFAIDIMKLSEVPALEAKTVGKMGLKGVAGLVVSAFRMK